MPSDRPTETTEAGDVSLNVQSKRCLADTDALPSTSLAAGLGMAVKNPIRLVAVGVAVEVTRRSKRRLFGLKGMAPLGEAFDGRTCPSRDAETGPAPRSCRSRMMLPGHRSPPSSGGASITAISSTAWRSWTRRSGRRGRRLPAPCLNRRLATVSVA